MVMPRLECLSYSDLILNFLLLSEANLQRPICGLFHSDRLAKTKHILTFIVWAHTLSKGKSCFRQRDVLRSGIRKIPIL